MYCQICEHSEKEQYEKMKFDIGNNLLREVPVILCVCVHVSVCVTDNMFCGGERWGRPMYVPLGVFPITQKSHSKC